MSFKPLSQLLPPGFKLCLQFSLSGFKALPYLLFFSLKLLVHGIPGLGKSCLQGPVLCAVIRIKYLG